MKVAEFHTAFIRDSQFIRLSRYRQIYMLNKQLNLHIVKLTMRDYNKQAKNALDYKVVYSVRRGM